MLSIRKERSSVKNKRKKANDDHSVQTSNTEVKVNHPIRYRPKESRKAALLTATRFYSIPEPTGARVMANDSRKPP